MNTEPNAKMSAERKDMQNLKSRNLCQSERALEIALIQSKIIKKVNFGKEITRLNEAIQKLKNHEPILNLVRASSALVL